MTIVAAPPGSPRRSRAATLVDRLSGVLDARTSRRGFLARVAVVGSAVTVGPVQYVLRPGTAYASVCGTDSTCGSGYTAFCATIQNGVNRCPPNALVGGWWKADNSGFCCGSARYYIDCHSYCSCGCGGGTSFCGEGCRSCSCGCGPTSSCDQRRVCCNNFRYGQCNQDVGCTGPVWCRVVTCTPPWRVPQWRCTATSATDNRTGSHTSEALPYCTAIDQHYTALGGPGSVLGEAVTAELTAPDGVGRFTHYDRGSIYWTSGTGAHDVQGAIRDRWAQLGWETGLGYPVTDESSTPDGVGRYNHFSRGASIYWTPSTGAHAVQGAIRDRWAQLGWETGLGYPLNDESGTPDRVGRYNHFSRNGSIYWTPSTGAHAVLGAIRDRWQQLGWETGPLGYPLTDESGTPDRVGRYNHFSKKGSIYWTPSTGAHAVLGPIRDLWQQLGWETGRLGYPVTDQVAVATRDGGTGAYNDFVGPGTASSPAASVYWSAATGAHSVSGKIRRAWLDNGGPSGQLRFPTSEPYSPGPGKTRSDFEGGYIIEDTVTGTVTVVPNP
jgi:uncharacterized protein with LGFP repeats